MSSEQMTSDRPRFGRRDPDARGYFGPYGGRFVPETLVAPVEDLERAYLAARRDQPHPDADDVFAAVGEDRRRDRRVHAAAHRDEYPTHAIAFICASTIAARSAPIAVRMQLWCSSSMWPI